MPLQSVAGHQQVVDLLVQGLLVVDSAVTDYPVPQDFDLDLARLAEVEAVAVVVLVAPVMTELM